MKNPTSIGTTSILGDSFSSLNAFKFSTTSGNPTIGEKITQTCSGLKAVGYVASYDAETSVRNIFKIDHYILELN